MEERVRLICIQTFFTNGLGNPFAMLAGGLAFTFFLLEVGVSAGDLVLWAGALLCTCATIFVYERYVRHVAIAEGNAERMLFVRCALGVVASTVFGLSVFLIPEQGGLVAALFGFIVAITWTTVSYMAFATVFKYCLLVNAVSVFPYIFYFFIRFVNHNDTLSLVAGLTSLVWNGIVISKAWHISRNAVEVIRSGERLQREITVREQIESALRGSQMKAEELATMLRLLCDNVPDMIWAKDLDNRFLFVNKAYSERILGALSTDEPVGKTYSDYFLRNRARHPENLSWHTLGEYSEDVDRHTLSRDEPTVFEEVGTVRGNNVYLDVHQARFVNLKGEVIGTVGCARDISERKASEAFVRHLAHHDVLTDLPNRLLFSDRLRQALAQARRDRTKLAILFLDLDNLKPVNDSYGHDVGDLMLKEVAQRLSTVAQRETDTVARFGGDEFVVLLSRINREQDAVAIAEQIIERLSLPLLVAGQQVKITASAGIALYPEHGEDGSKLLRNADHAMYAAKRAGRNTYRLYSVEREAGGEG